MKLKKDVFFRKILFIVLFFPVYGAAQTAGSYAAIERIASQYKRPITTLELQPGTKAYSFQLAKACNHAVSVMMDGNRPQEQFYSAQLLRLCKRNQQLRNIIYLNKVPDMNNLTKLSECEHFDIVFALNPLSQFSKKWPEALMAILNLGDHIFLSLPSADHDLIKQINGISEHIIETIPSEKGPLLHLKGTKTYLKRKTWFDTKDISLTHYISSDYNQKTLIKTVCGNTVLQSNWLPGINMLTYLMCNGEHPSRNEVAKQLPRLMTLKHNDWMLNNMIIQGKSLALIDWDDPDHFKADEYRRRRHQQFLILFRKLILDKDPKSLEELFSGS